MQLSGGLEGNSSPKMESEPVTGDAHLIRHYSGGEPGHIPVVASLVGP